MSEQVGRCHQYFQHDFVANVQVYQFHGKVEKEKALNHHKQENDKKGCVGKFTEIIITHTAQAHSELSQKSKMEPFANITDYFRKKLLLRGGSSVREFQAGLKFNSLNRDEISSYMSSNNNVKIELRLYVKISSR